MMVSQFQKIFSGARPARVMACAVMAAFVFIGSISIARTAAQAEDEVINGTVQDAVKAALKQHPQIGQAQAQFGYAEGEVWSVRSGMFPEISMNLTGGRMYGDNATSRGSTVTRGAAYSGLGEGSISAQQPIFDGFQTLKRLEAAKLDRHSAQLTLQDVREQIAYQATQSYLNVLQGRTVLKMMQSHKETMQSYMERISEMVDEGVANDAELQQANRVLTTLDILMTGYLEQLHSEEIVYRDLTGMEPYENMELPVLSVDWIPSNADGAVFLASNEHPAILAAMEDIKSSEYNIGAEKGGLYPELLGELSYLQSDKKEEIGGEVTDARAVLRMNWNIEAGGGQLARIKQRKYEMDEARARAREVKQQVERAVRLAYVEQEIAAMRLHDQKKQIEQNQKLFDTYKVQFEGGGVSLLQLMQAEDQLLNTQLENVAYKYRALAAQYTIVASLGRLQDVLFPAAVLTAAEETVEE